MNEWNFWTILTFSWRMPLIHTNLWGYEFAQPVGDNCSGREQKPESALQIPGQGFLAFGPLVVAEVRTE
jgi:hypothetical protein